MASTYDPKKVSVILGAHIAKGLAEGSNISVQRNSETFARKIGAGGETARVKSSDRSGRIVLTFMQTSETNDFLSAMFLADETSNSGKFPVLIVENGGTSLASAGEAWVIKPANLDYASGDMTNRVWTIETGDLTMNVGSVPST